MAGISALQKVKDIASFSKSDDFMVSIEAVISLLGISNPNTIQSIMHYIVDNGGAVRSILPAGFNHLEKAFNFAVHSYAEKSFILLKKLISASSAFVYQFILSFIFSSMIVWDRKYISNAVQSLKHSRLGFLYNEVSPKLSAFALVLGQTLEVQAIGSSINTVLTTLVLLSLRIPGLSFFAMLTFFSSFIPILGILISTIPPLVVALNEFGLSCGVQLIAMICLVHLFEGYVIYPQIYAAKMKLHPLLVMGSLAAFEHYFGVTGLLLAVPITHFVINEIIFGKNKSNDKLVSDSNSETA
jgi:predicted PurR-regulated permease PerM